METKEQLQENLYHFPYHHLTHEKNGGIYIFRHLFWGLEHYTYIKFVIDNIIKHQPKNLVDIGCGEGRIISEIKPHLVESTLYGYDISDAAIRFARAFIPNVEFNTHNIVVNPLEKVFDNAVSCEVIEHIKPEEVDNYCKNIANSLTQNGTFFLTTPTTNIPTSLKHYQHFTRELLEKHLSPYFEIDEVRYLNVVNWRSKLLNRLIANKFYLSNSPILNRWVLNQYKTKLLIGTEKTGSRIFIRARKK
ncbi:MAG: hypothetical protein RL538_309 [Candidatus Parcubacteria bacterium]|jgi:SAM-dependent methyltransferase